MNPAGKFNINFIPDEVVKIRQIESTKNSGNKFFIILTVIAALIAGGIYYYNYTLQSQLNNIESQITEKNKQVENLKEFGQEGYKLGVRLKNAKDIMARRSYYSKLYNDIVPKIPENIKITQWSLTEGGEFIFTGTAEPNYTPIADLRNNLLANGENGEKSYYSDAKLISSIYNKSSGKIEFVLQVSLNPEKITGK